MSKLPTSSNQSIEILPNSNDFSIALSRNTFADIILNFLGKKERLTYEVDEYFVLTQNQLEQFYFLIKEKVDRENNTIIENFSVDMLYDDNTGRQINGIEALQTYTENRDVTPHAVTATWHIINKARDLKGIEHISTQRVEISFITGDNQKKSQSNIRVNIESTNQAWANEILFTLQGHLSKIVSKNKRQYLREINKALGKDLDFDKDSITKIILLSLVIPLMTITLITILISPNRSSIPRNAPSIMDILNNEINNLSTNEVIILSHLIYSDSITKEDIEKTPLKSEAKDNILNNLANSRELQAQKRKNHILKFFIMWRWFSQPYYRQSSFITITETAKQKHKDFLESKNKFQYVSLSLLIVAIITGLIINTSYELFHDFIFMSE